MNSASKMALCFDDVLLQPQYSKIESRSEVDISPQVSLNKLSVPLRSPIVASPMDTVTNAIVAKTLIENGGFAVLHRYNTIDRQLYEFNQVMNDNVCCAIPATGDYLRRVWELHDAGCNIFCIDVAHGHHILVKNALKALRSEFGVEIHLMTGNVSTLEAFNDLSDWGASSVRIGVGGGSACSTRIQTGHGLPTLQSIIDCAKTDRDTLLIADGGIRNSGDIVKALAFGADFVMLGGMLSGHSESPGEVFYVNGERRKTFRGMASKEAQEDWRGKSNGTEGISTTVPFKGQLCDTLEDLHNGIRSGFSYSGARNVNELRAKMKYSVVSTNTVAENVPHAKRM